MYIVEWSMAGPTAPIDEAALAQWIERVQAMTVDGTLAMVDVLGARLEEFWWPKQRVVYIGLAGTSVASRVAQYYRTPLGDRRPHAGGHWLKTLTEFAAATVWYGATAEPADVERRMLQAFSEKMGAKDHRFGLPFANLEFPGGPRKPHGLRGTRSPAASPVQSSTRIQQQHSRRAKVSPSKDLGAINIALQAFACSHPDRRVTAVDAAKRLDQVGLLKDSASRAGKPLRDLLRAGLIDHAHQHCGTWWFIECRRQ